MTADQHPASSRHLRRRSLPALGLVLAAMSLLAAGCGGDEGDSSTTAAESSPTTTSPDSAGAAAETTTGDSSGSSGGRPVADPEVEIVDFTYEPAEITVAAGAELVVNNQDSTPHTLTADDGSFDTGEFDGGKSAKVTLDQAGSFSYICTIHPYMKGTIEVVEG